MLVVMVVVGEVGGIVIIYVVVVVIGVEMVVQVWQVGGFVDFDLGCLGFGIGLGEVGLWVVVEDLFDGFFQVQFGWWWFVVVG